MDVRQIVRIVVNVLTLILATLTHPSFGAMVPVDWLPTIASVSAGMNTVLSMMRWAADATPAGPTAPVQ